MQTIRNFNGCARGRNCLIGQTPALAFLQLLTNSSNLSNKDNCNYHLLYCRSLKTNIYRVNRGFLQIFMLTCFSNSSIFLLMS